MSLETVGSPCWKSFQLQQHLSCRPLPTGRGSPVSHPCALVHSGWCYRSVQTCISTLSLFESHKDHIAVPKIKHYTRICINNLFECISSPLTDYVHLYDIWSVFQILPFSILTATVLHVDILSIPKAEASTTFPKAP